MLPPDTLPPTRADVSRSQRLRASQALLVLGVYAVFAVVQHVEVLLGMIDEAASWRLTAWNLSGGCLFYALIRSGANLRWTGDPALSFPQSLWAMAGIAWSYAITGPARGGVMLIMTLVVMFGIFSMTPRQSRALAATAFAALGAVMLWKSATDPLRYDPRVEVMHLVFAAVVLWASATLAARHGRLRARLVEQRTELANALDRIQALATRDELTGLLNRRAAMDCLRAELRRRDRGDAPLAVALIDLDHFKRINDLYGHAAGDRVLRTVAQVAGAEVRSPDILARWGGEEFLLTMPGTGEAAGIACLQRIRQRLQEVTFDDLAPGLRITFSAGVAACSGEADLEPAIDRADRAMYGAKHSGRDRIVGHGGGIAPAPARPAGAEPAAATPA